MTDMPNSSRTAPFVRAEMLGEQPPPSSTTGALAWLRENLFRGPVNSAITLIILGVIAWMTPGIVSWAFLEATWDASSLAECREKGDGACWAVIVERFGQFVYGFYPHELRWRPNLAFMLMLVAFVFALADRLPYVSDEVYAKIRPYGLIFAACYPIVAFYLIWGGSLWPLVGVLVAGGAAYLALSRSGDFVPDNPYIPFGVTAVGGAIATYVVIDLLAGSFGGGGFGIFALLPYFLCFVTLGAFAAIAVTAWQSRDENAGQTPLALAVAIFAIALALFSFIPGGEDGVLPAFGFQIVESKLLGGFLLATIIGVAGIVLSLPIGIVLALGRRSGLFFIQTVCIVFIEFIRGVPLITLLFVANSVIQFLFPPDTQLDIILRVVIMVTAFASAYMAEVIRGGLASLPPGQYEAADAMGLTYWQATRLIIMPQALKVSIPNIVNTFIGLFKDTTLVVVIGLLDVIGLITNIRADAAWNGIIWEFYVFAGLFFFIACFAMSRYSMYLERKLATDRR
ncbi:MAG: amino acid ABC transporter permease [Pseudomonadota bacterium]